MSSIKVIKLSSGEVLVANMVEDLGHTVTVKDVARVVEVPPRPDMPEGQMNIAMIPFMPFTKAAKSMVIGSSQIVFIVDPIDEIITAHNNEFSKIVKPKSTGLILPS